MTARERAALLLMGLDRHYPEAACSLDHRSVYELLVATVLSAQCTDERVNLVTPALFKKYPAPKQLAAARLSDVERLIHSCGFFRAKAAHLVQAAQAIQERFQGEVPRTMEELLTLPGVARKTANVILGTGYGLNAGFVVDTHVARLSQRLGLTSASDPKQIERALTRLFPQESWTRASHQLIAHGRSVCTARKPGCQGCPFTEFCPKRGLTHNKTK